MNKGEGPYNVVVIGAGTAGLVTAAGTAGLGGRVALIERHKMGGDCLNYGCVPSKALIRSSRVAALMRRAGDFALDPVSPLPDHPRLIRRVKERRARLAPGDSVERFEGLGVDVFLGQATLESPHAVRVGETLLRTSTIVLATGGRADVPEIPGLREAGFLTNETVFEREESPGRLLLIGGGPIGCELAQAMARLGAQVTLVDRGPQLLHREDPDVAALLLQRLTQEGVRCLLRARVESIRPGHGKPHRARVTGEDGGTSEIETDTILVCAGRRPNVEGLGLENTGVTFTSRGVTVDLFQKTTRSNIYAVGDVCGPYLFTHFAEHQARVVVRNILVSPLLGVGRARVDHRVVPWATFTEPEVARVGLNETAAARADLPVDVHRFPYSNLDRAVLESDEEGFVKVIAAKGRGTLLGATVVGAGAGELIHELALAMKQGISLATLSSLMHVYPTLSQAVQRAGDAYMRTRLTPRTRALFSRLYAWQRRGL